MEGKGLAEWDNQTINLVRSLLGAISPNFRMVTIVHDGVCWKLVFFLEREDEVDREEIDESCVQFEALQSGPIRYDMEIEITSAPLPWPQPPVRVIYRRRE